MNHGAKAGGWQRAGRAALTLLILAGIVFVAYHDWVMAVAALLLIGVFVYTDLPRWISESAIGKALQPVGKVLAPIRRGIRKGLLPIENFLKRIGKALGKPFRKAGGRMTMERKRSFEALIFLAPWLVGFCLFFLGPITTSIRLSFSEIVKMKGFQMGFVGLENYRYIFFYDLNFVPMFLQTVSDTLLNTPICLVFSLAIAILINRPMKGRGFFRAAFFIPVLLGAGYVMKQMLGMGADGTTITTASLCRS